MTNPPNRRRKAKILGGCEHAVTIAAQNEDGSVELISGSTLENGKALPPGNSLYSVSRDKDGTLTVETVVEGSGPPKASSPAYRKNYDKVFPPKKVAKHLN